MGSLRFWAIVLTILISRAPAMALATSGPELPETPEIKDTVERDFPLRSLGELRLSNARGNIIIEGWAQDRIRVKALRKAKVKTSEEAKRLFGLTDVQFKTVDDEIEVSAQYGRGLKIEDRLKERNQAQVSMDLSVLAPAHLPLKIWAVNGKVIVKGWNANLEVRTDQGPIEIESMKKGSLSILCPSCSVKVKSARSSLRCMGGVGAIELTDVEGSPIYVESEAGSVTLKNISGEQLYVTHAGSVSGENLHGRIEFHTRQGNVKITHSSGFLSGRTDTGSINAQMDSWNFLDKALVESSAGDVSLSLPAKFSGEVDLRSGSGKVYSGFPLTQPRAGTRSGASGPDLVPSRRTLSRLMGLVGEGGEQLKLASESGDVSLLSASGASFQR